MANVAASGSTSSAALVEMESEAPPSDEGNSAEGVSTAVTTISGKAVQDGPPKEGEMKAGESESGAGGPDAEAGDARTQELRQDAVEYRAEAQELRTEVVELRQEAEELREESEELDEAGDSKGADKAEKKSEQIDRKADRLETDAERLEERADTAEERADRRDQTASERRGDTADADAGDSGSTSTGQSTTSGSDAPPVVTQYLDQHAPASQEAQDRVNAQWTGAVNGDPASTGTQERSKTSGSPASPPVVDKYIEQNAPAAQAAQDDVNGVWRDAVNGGPSSTSQGGQAGTPAPAPAASSPGAPTAGTDKTQTPPAPTAAPKAPPVVEKYVEQHAPAAQAAQDQVNDVWRDAVNGRPTPPPSEPTGGSKGPVQGEAKPTAAPKAPPVVEKYVEQHAPAAQQAQDSVNDLWSSAVSGAKAFQTQDFRPDPQAQMEWKADVAIQKHEGTGVNRSPFNNDNQIGHVEMSNTSGLTVGDSMFLRSLGDGNGFMNKKELVEAQKKGLITIDDDGKINLTKEGKEQSKEWNEARSAKTTPSKPATPAKPENGFVTKGGDVHVDIKPSSSGYNNQIYWSADNFKTKHAIGVDNQQASVNIGSFPPGTVIQFGIDNGQGNFFVQGDADRNSDKKQHAKVEARADGSQRIGFEDLNGGGDMDFDDAVIEVKERGTASV